MDASPSGHMFDWRSPFSKHPVTQSRVMTGLPFSAFCCWNGAIVINATGFYEGIVFRDANPERGECLASECSLFCKDMWALNHGRVVMDPHVRVAYQEDVYAKVNTMYWLTNGEDRLPSKNEPWIVERNVPMFEKPVNWTCCSLLGTKDIVIFEETCASEPLE